MEQGDSKTFRPPYTGQFGPWFNYLENTETVTPPVTAGLRQALIVDTAGTVTLPKAADAQHGYFIKNISSGTVTVSPNGSETIDGAASYSLDAQYKCAHVISDGSNWHILSAYAP